MDKFDKNMKEAFDNEQLMPTSEDYSWENMNIELPQKKKKRRFIWIFLFVGVLLLSTTVTAYFLMSDTKETYTEVGFSSNKITKQKIDNTEIDQKENTAISSTNQEPKVLETKSQTSNFKNQNFPKKKTSHTDIPTKTKRKETTIAKVPSNENKTLYNKAPEKDNIIRSSSAAKHWEDSRQKGSTIIAAPTAKKVHTKSVIIATNKISSLSRLPLVFLDQIEFDIKKQKLPILNFIEKDNPPTKVNQIKSHFLSLSGGTNFSKFTTQTTDDLYNTEMNAAMTNIAGYNAALMYGHRVKDNFSISVGLAYHCYKTLFKYRELTDMVMDVQSLVISTTNIYRRVVQNNKHTNLSIPVSLEWYLVNNKKFQMGLNLGGAVNFNQKNNGKVLDMSYSIVDANGYLTPSKKYYLSGSLGLSLSHKISNATALFISSGIQSNGLKLNNPTKSNAYKIPINYNQQLGIRINL